MRELTVLCASGSLGLTPFHEESFWDGVARRPGAICADAGSGDIGPFYLGSDEPYNPPEWEKHDLRLMLLASRQLDVPMVVGSCGGAGTNRAVDLYADLVREIAAEEGLPPFTVARIYAEVDRGYLRQRAEREVIAGLGAPNALTPADVDASSRVVAMMGVEPLVEALDRGAQVVLAGRSSDDAVFAAVPIRAGFDRGLALHMGKCIECGPLVATPILQREAVQATVRDDHFLIEPLHPGQRCTPASVAGHTLYERCDPYHQPGPGGTLDLTATRFVAHDERVVKVSGSRWLPSERYCVKLEGAGFVGYRALFLFGLRDPLSVANVDSILDCVRAEVRRIYPAEEPGRDYHLVFHVYGKNAIMKHTEPLRESRAHELAVVVEVVARTRALAANIAKLAKYTSLRAHYEGKLGTAGGAAMLADEVLEPHLQAYRWTVDHLLPIEHPGALFPIALERVGAG